MNPPQGVLTFSPTLDPLPWVSPSRAYSMTHCALREALSGNSIQELLIASPGARLGTVIHRVLQEAGDGRLEDNPAEVDARWNELVAETERGMRLSWLEQHLVPLRRSVPQFEVRRLQTRERAHEVARAQSAVRASPDTRPPYGFELGVSTSDGLVRGRIDAVLPSSEGPVIRDYKSGAILEAVGHSDVLKESYAMQLRLYAALYFETFGQWPVRLEVLPVAGEAYVVSYSRTEAAGLVLQAKETLHRVNAVIAATAPHDETQRILANPSGATCMFCSYRPGCLPYRAAARAPGRSGRWPSDAWGTLRRVRDLGNNRRMIELDAGDEVHRVRDLSSDRARHPALQILEPGDPVAVFGLRPTASRVAFTESLFTVIYKETASS